MTMTTGTNDTTVEVDDTVPLVRITREFDAPVAKVFRAHTDADIVKRWLGPRRYETIVERWDCRQGGEWRLVHRGADGDEHRFRGCFHDVRPEDGVIVQTFTYEGAPDGVSLERLELHDLGGGRTRLVATSLVDSFEARDAFVASGMEDGVVESYERLDEVLAD
jgi:uncharacterized protein YndB with AHSA1/START domain